MCHPICCMTVSNENAAFPKPTKSRNSDSSVSCNTDLNWDLNLYRGIWVSRFGGFRGSSIFSGNCQINVSFSQIYWGALFHTMIQTYSTVYLAHCVCTHVWLNMLCKCVTQYCIHVSVSQMKKSYHTDSPALEYPLEQCVVYTCLVSCDWKCCIRVSLLHVIECVECVVWMCLSMCYCFMWLTALYKCVSQCVVLYTCVIISYELCAHSFIPTIQTYNTCHLAHYVVYMCHWYDCTQCLGH